MYLKYYQIDTEFLTLPEGAKFWLHVLTDLQNRGVNDILIASVDGLKGFPEAINSVFPHTEVQLCIVHQIRNSIRFVGSLHQKQFASELKAVYQAFSKEEAENECSFNSDFLLNELKKHIDTATSRNK